ATVFLNAGVFRPSLIHERAGRGAAREDIFVIHNGKLSEASSATLRSLRGIASRVIEASVRAGVVTDLIRIYAFAQRDQASFHWVTIDERVDLKGAEVFDPVKMGELYEIGYRTARAGPKWEVRPPGFEDVQPPP
ncbi:MAG: patatin-like phospholipase family protein, partial [Actinomycetota bacterium]|nr:patatin-like phospholipase family protein [Actinomycetota bacterium]